MDPAKIKHKRAILPSSENLAHSFSEGDTSILRLFF